VPIVLDDSWGGLATNKGVLRLEADGLIVEFETRDAVFERVASDPQRVAIPFAQVVGLEWRPGWFSNSLELNVATLDALRNLPGSSQGRVRFNVARRDRVAAQHLAVEVQLALARQTIASSSFEVDTPPSPTHTPPA
jgi:hypothetical protein